MTAICFDLKFNSRRCFAGAFVVGVLMGSSPAQSQSLGDKQPVMSTAILGATAGTARLTHIQVGHPMFLNMASRVSRLYIANPAVLDSFVSNPKLVILTPKATGTTPVVLWSEDGTVNYYTVSADADIDELRKSLHDALPEEELEVNSSGSRVMLTGSVSSRAAADSAVKIAGLFSKEVVDSIVVNSARVKQVELKVRFLEVDRARLTQFGINIFGPGGSSSIGGGGTTQFPSTMALTNPSTSGSSGSTTGGNDYQVGTNILTVTNPLNYFFYNSKLGTGVTIQDLESKQIGQILAEPTIVTLNGQPASFLAGGEFPFPVVQSASGGPTSITIQFRAYGVKLDFTPKVNVDGTIELKVMPEVSSLDYANAVSISGYTIPAISTKHAETQVVLRSGQSFAISGLLDRQTTDSLSRTPGLANIPILGALFKSKNVNLATTELIVIVTPTVVDPLTATAVPKEPGLSRPLLDSKTFDKTTPGTLAGKDKSN
jgi:pilus assembly protein CpaC